VNGLDAKFKASIAKRYEAERGSGDTGKPGGESAAGSAQGQIIMNITGTQRGGEFMGESVGWLSGVRRGRVGSGVRHGRVGNGVRHGRVDSGVRHGRVGNGVRHGRVGSGVRHGRVGSGVRRGSAGSGVRRGRVCSVVRHGRVG
jgi:hypothetical protein